MEADYMHGNITRQLNTLVDHSSKCYTPGRLLEIISTAVATKQYHVTELTEQSFRDYNELVGVLPTQNATADISRAKAIAYTKVCTRRQHFFKLS